MTESLGGNNVLFLDLGSGYTGVCLDCENSLSCVHLGLLSWH